MVFVERVIVPKVRTLEEFRARESLLLRSKARLVSEEEAATVAGREYVAARKRSRLAREELLRLI